MAFFFGAASFLVVVVFLVAALFLVVIVVVFLSSYCGRGTRSKLLLYSGFGQCCAVVAAVTSPPADVNIFCFFDGSKLVGPGMGGERALIAAVLWFVLALW